MKYDILLFDADDTLLDFKKSEEICFQFILEKNGIRDDNINTSSLYTEYKLINNTLWDQYALGLITKEYLKIERFKRLIDKNNLGVNPLQLCDDYLESLPEQVFLIDGARELLESLHGKIPLIIVTNGIADVQEKRLTKSGLKPFIEFMVISDSCGFTKPDRRIFDYTFDQIKTNPMESKILMIGDKLETDILGSHNVEIDSCWFNPNKEANDTTIVPTYEIQNILDVLKLLK